MVQYPAFPPTVLLSSVFADGSTWDCRSVSWSLVFLQKVSLNGAVICLDRIRTMMCDCKYHCKYQVIFASVARVCRMLYFIFHLPKTSLLFRDAVAKPSRLLHGGFICHGFFIYPWFLPGVLLSLKATKTERRRVTRRLSVFEKRKMFWFYVPAGKAGKDQRQSPEVGV